MVVIRKFFCEYTLSLNMLIGKYICFRRSKIDPASAMEHMLQLCARLNVTTVSSVRDPDNEDEMLFHVSRPVDG